ncbi:hypothetical protein DQ353_19995 [Arthrobacter sp. AQ5-05]|nr:hypothetical protein DQ353_19995 [Arthrobacter sp. AQ5-05]
MAVLRPTVLGSKATGREFLALALALALALGPRLTGPGPRPRPAPELVGRPDRTGQRRSRLV